jgi:hypothetical protein
MRRGYSATVFSVRQEHETLSFISRLLEPTTARRRLGADAQVRALPSQKCQRRRLDAGLDSFRRIENAFCRVFGPKEVDRHVEHHHVRCGDASRRPRFEKRARCRISLGWAVRELVHELTARFIQIGFRDHQRSNAQIARDDAAERLTQ